MEPNYKSFLAWKKSSRGREFVAQMDESELEKLRHSEINSSKNRLNNNQVNSQINNINNVSSKINLSQNPIKRDHQEEILEELELGEHLGYQSQRINFENNIQNKITNNFDNNKKINNINSTKKSIISNIPVVSMSSSNNNHNNIKNVNFNFDTNKNKELHLNSNMSNANNINNNVSRPSINNIQNNQNNIQNNQNNNNDSKSFNLSFNKMHNAIKKSNPAAGNNAKEGNKGTSSQKKKRNIYFQLVSKELVAIETDFFLEPALMAIIKESGGKFDRESRMWYAPYRNYIQVFTSMKDCQALGDTSLFPITNLPIEVIASINYTILKYTNEEEKCQIDYSKDRLHSIFELPSSMLSNLYAFQKTGIEFGVKKKGRMLLADEMGVGKTIQAIGISAVFKENWPVLILCPSSLRYNWRDEICNWLKDIITEKDVQIIKKTKDDFDKKAKFYIISYDLSIRVADKIAEKKFEFAIADEVHYLKSRESKRSKLMVPILQKCKRVLLLSGTPILAKPVEIYPILRILRPDLFKSFKPFGSRYCDPKQTAFGIDWNGAINSKELHYLLSNIMIRRLKKDVLSELPPKKRQKVEVQTDAKILNQIRILLNKSGKVDIENENIMSRILNQGEEEEKEKEKEGEDNDVLSCFTKAYALTGKAKIIGIVDYVGYLLENNCKFLIFAHHRDVLDAIEEEVKKQGVKYIRIDGSVAVEKRHIMVHTFQNDENCLVAVLGITACATGLTLTKASTVVFAEMHFTPAIMIQAEDRAHRIGQEHNCVNVHYLFGTDTVDEMIFPKLREKFFVVSSTLDNKRMDMDVQKIKSGCIGDFETKNKKDILLNEDKEGNEVNNSNSNSNSNINKKPVVLNINKTTSNNTKKVIKLTDFFKVKEKNKLKSKEADNKNNNIKIGDEMDELIEGMLQDEEFIKSLTASEIKENINIKHNYDGIEQYVGDDSTSITNINLHEHNFKRERKHFDSQCNEFSLLDESEDSVSQIFQKRNLEDSNKNNN